MRKVIYDKTNPFSTVILSLSKGAVGFLPGNSKKDVKYNKTNPFTVIGLTVRWIPDFSGMTKRNPRNLFGSKYIRCSLY